STPAVWRHQSHGQWSSRSRNSGARHFLGVEVGLRRLQRQAAARPDRSIRITTIGPLSRIMIIGLPKEIKDNEYRVGLTPAGVLALKDAGNEVRVELNAGAGSGFEDSLYERAGATIGHSADDVWASAEMIVKVKEPIAPEYPRMREGQLLFTYLHLAPDHALTDELIKRKVTGIAYETITHRGTLPLLTPMSEVAGRMSIQVGTDYLVMMMDG